MLMLLTFFEGGNCTVRTPYQGTLGAAAFQPPPPSYDDLVPILDCGEERVRIREARPIHSRHVASLTRSRR